MNEREHGIPAPVIWLTGLSGAGKSTIARGLERAMQRARRPVVVLDGDEMRGSLCRGLGFSREDRDENVRRIGVVASMIARSGVTAVVAAISPYRIARDHVREGAALFVEVYVRCPLPVLEARDPKGLYARARSGSLAHMTGIDDPYEEPLHAELVLDTAEESPSASVERVVAYLAARVPGALGDRPG
jgi:adenylylsulfate kinase